MMLCTRGLLDVCSNTPFTNNIIGPYIKKTVVLYLRPTKTDYLESCMHEGGGLNDIGLDVDFLMADIRTEMDSKISLALG